MKKKPLVITLLILVFAAAAGMYILPTKQSYKTDEEIKEELRCNRKTLEILATDVYCQDPDLYRKHLRENNVIGPSDYYRNQ